MAKKIFTGRYEFNPSERTVKIPDNIAPDRFLVITNVTTNEIIYNFAKASLGYDSAFYDFSEDKTIISLKFDTTSMSANDKLQIFIEMDSQEITPADDLLDPVGKMRVSNPENLIDTDFEYGLQATKWETLQTVNNIPTIYSSSGDTPLDGIVSVESIAGSKNILATFDIPHGLSIGDPISVQGLSQYQAEGVFVVSSVPDTLSFFFELDVPAVFTGDLSGSYTTIVPGKFFEGSTLPVSTADGAVTDGLSPSSLSVITKETHGFSPRTKVYLRNTVGPRVLTVADSTLTAPDGRPYVDTVDSFAESLAIDNTESTGRGTAADRTVTTYDWESTYTQYLSPASIDTVNNQITWNGHNLRDKYALLFNTPYHGSTDGGLEDGVVYYVEVIDADTIRLHTNNSLTSAVTLQNLTNEYGFARLGLVYKVEEADGTLRFTEAYIVNQQSATGFTQQDGGQIISDPNSSGGTVYNTDVDVTAVLGGNPTNVVIKNFLIAGDFNSTFETITVTIDGTTVTSNSGQQSGTYFNMRDTTFDGFDVSSALFTSGGRTYFTVTHQGSTGVNDLGYFSPSAAYRINIELENTGVGGNLSESDKEYSGGDLYDNTFGLGLTTPSALVAFQGRTSFSYSNSNDAFSYQTNQRNNGRYGVLGVKYNNVVTGANDNGSFDIDFNDNNVNYGTNSEIFYIFARPVASTRNTLFIPDHGIDSGESSQTVDITVNSTDYSNGDRFSFGSSSGSITDMPDLFQAEVTVLNPDTIRITTTQSPNTNDIARAPKNFTISYNRSNELYNSIYVNNHKVRQNTDATYTNTSGTAIPPLVNNDVIELERVNDSRLRLAQSGAQESGNASTTIGSSSNSQQVFFIPCGTDLGFAPTTVTINSLDFRGDFSASNEYVDMTFDDNDFYRIGQFDDIGDSGTFTQSTTFNGKDVTSLLFDNGGVIGFNITIQPTSAVNFSPISGSSDWWQFRFNYQGSSTGLVFEGPGSGSHEFLVNNLVGAYDGIFSITEVDEPNSFVMESDFQIPTRTYEFTSTEINTGDDSITLPDPHNFITGEKLTYNNNGNSNVVNTSGGNDFFAIAVTDTNFKVASSFADALQNNPVTLTSQTGTHEFVSSSVIKSIKGSGDISTTGNTNVVVGNGTRFLTNFKRFDKIYINNGLFVQEFTVNTITTQEKMTLFETIPSTLTSVDYYFATQLSLRPDGFSLHLPFDGGVDITAGTSPNSRIVRQSRKYFRYQSGKGIQNSFAINFNPPRLVRELIKSDGSIATVLTQEQHNLQPGDVIIVDGSTVESGANTYNGTFPVASTPDEFTFTYDMGQAPEDVRAGGFPTFVRQSWTDSFIRAGMFDDQNGFFFEYNGQKLYAVRRSSTQQIAGSVNVQRASQVVQGIGTSFNSQLTEGEFIVIRGQSYKVVEVSSDQRLVVQPEYRGVDAQRVKITKTIDTRTPQEDWNIDPADGSGFTGYNIDINKIQMAYIDYSWYGAGKIRYGFKDNNGHVRYMHEYKHNNRLIESYFRSGNLPGRYEIANGSQSSTAPTLFHFGTSIIMDGRFDDDKAYQFTGQSKPFAFTNGSSDNFTSSGDTVFSQVTLGGNRVFVYSIPVDEATAQSAVEGLQILVSGSNDLPSGTYVTQVRVDGANSRIFTSYPATTTDPTGGTLYPAITSGSTFVLGESTPIDLTRPIPLISVRLAPSVDSSVTGALGEREIVNRMQLKLQEASVTSSSSIEIFLLQNAIPSTINYIKAPRPSLSEIIEHSAGDTLLEGTAIYSTKASSGSFSFRLEELLEIGNSILGGDGIFPAGPDLLTLAVLPQNTSQISGGNPFFVSGKVSWSESQA